MPKFKKIIFAVLLGLLSSVYSPLMVSAQDVHGIVDVNENCLMGGISAGKWLEADALAPLLKGGERYRLYTLTKALGETTGANPNSAGEPCNETKEVAFSPKVEDGIAVGGQWNALPRVPRALSTKDPAYRQVVANILRRHGFVRPKINITQILRIDLDGDGIEEVLVSATHLAGGLSVNGGPMAVQAKPGDYTLVFLRKLVKGKAQDIILVEAYYPRATEEPWSPPEQNSVAAVLDLNGDGKMEIIVHGMYYEGSSSSVFRLDGNKVENVFGCGCGA
ncbi:MAG: hypothetical protein QOH25_2722 [Acidobacteriota bacterium]|jgi:hypothetical protein|nr:hypothetical protein [Acidobacteriota bacterium]